ncbi:MAG: UDP-N-acetylglucosamine 2-epimerase (non-hydrolyzing) [Candidatus Sumerlaeia bacterium]|nr:UDP-N-acetylglucosamine 2-epimerase (non-hydrolyzing) [Candidatus Sumerlaeia bacterium]
MKLLTVVGARPNFMKAAPLHWAVEKWNANGGGHIDHRIVHTGQHYDTEMSDVFFENLGLPMPNHCLSTGSCSQAAQVGRAMIDLEGIFVEEKPDWVVVVGDVNATLSATLAAKKLLLRVAHVEAGLRSGDWTMPEEINRILVDRVADLLLTPGEIAAENLYREGTPGERVLPVGNIMIDTLEMQLRKLDEARNGNKLPSDSYAVATIHRPSNVDDSATLSTLIDCLGRLSTQMPIYFPMHPRTRGRVEEFRLGAALNGSSRIHVMEPLGYMEMLALTSRASLVLTDSGGLQEETTVLGVPCITIRDNTERPETLVENGGTALLAGNDPEKITHCVDELLRNKPTPIRPPLWDGKTGERIVEILWKHRHDPPRGTIGDNN